jgi:hypothetical protein
VIAKKLRIPAAPACANGRLRTKWPLTRVHTRHPVSYFAVRHEALCYRVGVKTPTVGPSQLRRAELVGLDLDQLEPADPDRLRQGKRRA